MRDLPHHLNNAILLSPAGIHHHIPLPVYCFGWFFHHVISKFVDHVALPNIVVDCLNKVHKDIRSLPACKDLTTLISSKILGGYGIGESPIGKSAKLLSSMLLFGLPMDLINHFWQNRQKSRFSSHDFGDKERNREISGTDGIVDYLANYNLIDIDIHYFISMND